MTKLQIHDFADATDTILDQGNVSQSDHYIDLDPSDGTWSEGSRYAWDNGVPFGVYHGRILRVWIPWGVRGKDITALVETHRELLQRVIDSHEEEWDGSNWLGSYDDEAWTSFCQEVEAIEPYFEVWDAADYFAEDNKTELFEQWRLTAEHRHKVLEAYIQPVEDHEVLSGAERYLERLTEEFEERLAEQ